MTLWHELLDATAARAGMRHALRHRGLDISYEELQDRSRRLAGAFAALGVSRGTRVVAFLHNRPAVVEIALACSRLGAIFVPANPAMRARQLAHVLRDCAPHLVVTSHLRDEVGLQHQGARLVICDLPASVSARNLDALNYDELFASAPHDQAAPVIEQDPAAILYTSGSTGLPKGVVLSHRNIVAGARLVTGYLNNVPDDRILAALPLSFDYGLSQVTTALSVGACAVLTNYTLAGGLLQELAAERITGLAGVPTMWAQVASMGWPPVAQDSLRYITNSGGALAPALLRSLRARLPRTSIFSMYGLTEAFRSTYLDPAELSARSGSIGKALPTQEVLVVRPDGSPCKPGEVGELVHRGSLVTLGYWNSPELTAQRFRPLRLCDGSVREEIAVWSGDQVSADADGYLYFVGRSDALIKTSGYRVSPTEVEDIVSEVRGVIECCAIGVGDATLGQRIVVAIVAAAEVGPAAHKDLIERIQQHCRMQLPAYMVPSEIRIVDAIERNMNGKHDRAALALALADTAEPARESGSAS
jgi:acyl-CoA ligase (AMP-forming) (exosortase A-associated)